MHGLFARPYQLFRSIPHQMDIPMQNRISTMMRICGSLFNTGIGFGGTLQLPAIKSSKYYLKYNNINLNNTSNNHNL